MAVPTRVAKSLNSAFENGMNLRFGAPGRRPQSVKKNQSTRLNLQEWTKAQTTAAIRRIDDDGAIFI
jgi:hypothetical protein